MFKRLKRKRRKKLKDLLQKYKIKEALREDYRCLEVKKEELFARRNELETDLKDKPRSKKVKDELSLLERDEELVQLQLTNLSIRSKNFEKENENFQRKKIASSIIRDWFPRRRDVQEDGIHAKLNYQNIADSQRRSMSILLAVIVLFTMLFITGVYLITEGDELVAEDDVENYSEYMIEIKKEVLGANDKGIIKRDLSSDEEAMLEDNTSLYWGVFFFRFILVRLIIGVSIGIIIAFLIRIYFRIRHDRAVNIHKEEALSTIQYVARGEWRLKYNDIKETYDEVPYIDGNEKHVLSTSDFLKTLPISTLFEAPDSDRRRRRRDRKPDKELVNTMKQIVSTLSKIEEDLRSMKGGGNTTGS